MIDWPAWMARGAALATAIAALELLVMRREIRAQLSVRLSPLALVQLASALALPWCSYAAWPALLCVLGVAVACRGTYNGGSDSMLVIVLGALALASVGQARAGMAYAAAQLVLSYFIAGIAKLRDREWRDGRALPILLALPQYNVPPRLAALLARTPRAAAWAMLAFECAFPLALLGGKLAAGFLVAGAAFHLANAVCFGLNRFLWTWLAAYPALLFFTSSR